MRLRAPPRRLQALTRASRSTVWLTVAIAAACQLRSSGSRATSPTPCGPNYQRDQLTNAPIRLIKGIEAEVRKTPNDVILRVRLGEAYGAAGKYDQAVEQFKQALKIDPKHVGAYLDLGMVAVLTENDAAAERYFKKVIELTETAQIRERGPASRERLLQPGLLKLKQKKYEEAAGYFKEALRIRKDASDTYV